MSKIIFVQRLWYEFPGAEILSACLKKRGHSVDMVIGDDPSGILKDVKGADILAFSVMTGSHDWALAMGRELKRRTGAAIIFGGPHPTYFPEIVYEDGVDAICVGEGEGALADMADRIDRHAAIDDIPNLWVKRGGDVSRNDMRPLITDLDSLPFPDRELYYGKYRDMRENRHRPFMAGRGCPYDCSFCFNGRLKELYRGKGAYVRLRSPDNIIGEIQAVKDAYPTTRVFFHDDTFVLDHMWLKEFLKEYCAKIDLPFFCQARADTVTDETAKELKKAGCMCVFFAIESGDEELRKRVLNKDISDKQIKESARCLKENGIKVSTYNMIGIPGESIEQAFKTVRLNIEIGADYPRCSFLTPYSGTRIADYAKEHGLLADGAAAAIGANSQQTELFIKTPDARRFRNLHSFFQTAVLFPRAFPLIRMLIGLPLGLVYRLWWATVYFIVFTKSEGRSFKAMLIFAARSARSGMRLFKEPGIARVS